MHYHPRQYHPKEAIPHQFDTFRSHHPPQDVQSDEERGQLLMRIHQLEEQISKVNGRATHLQMVNEKLNQIIVNYHTKNNIKMDQFLHRIDHLIHKTNTIPHQSNSTHNHKHSLSKNKSKINKSNSITKITKYQQMGSFARIKTQQANSESDENNSMIANVHSGLSRAQLKKRVGSKR